MGKPRPTGSQRGSSERGATPRSEPAAKGPSPRRRAPSRTTSSASSSPSPARAVAHWVLTRVAEDEAWAERALNAGLNRAQLDTRDRALCTELVYGTLRNRGYLDFVLGRLTDKPLRKLPLQVLGAMRMGAYELLSLRSKPYAVINDCVTIVKQRHKHLRGVANAVLRKVETLHTRGELPSPEEAFDDSTTALAVRTSHPRWLVTEVTERLGEAQAAAWCEANNRAPSVPLRVNTSRITRSALADRLREGGAEVVIPEPFEEALLVSQSGSVEELPGFGEGLFTVQDPAAQLVALLCPLEPGMTLLDACAAPGGKTLHVAQRLGDSGRVLSCDVHPGKTRLIVQGAKRLGVSNVLVATADASDEERLREVLEDHAISQLDGVILDAPCTGSGTLRRHPELRWRLDDDHTRLVRTQRALLETVSRLLTPGGFLVYSVCSVTREEGPRQVGRFIDAHPEFEWCRPDHPALAPFVRWEEGGWGVVTWTHEVDADGFYAALLRRRP